MADKPAPKEGWYIFTNDPLRRESLDGPYSVDRLRALLKEGRINSTTRIYQAQHPEHTLLVVELLQSISDPAFTLFEALQAAKTKKTPWVPETPPDPYEHKPSQPHWFRIIILGLIILAGILGFVLSKLKPQPSTPSTPQTQASPPPKTTPPRIQIKDATKTKAPIIPTPSKPTSEPPREESPQDEQQNEPTDQQPYRDIPYGENSGG